jgi:hypothetical protein
LILFYTVNIATEITQILSCTQEEESSSARSGERKRSGTGFCEFANEYISSLQVRNFVNGIPRITCTVEWSSELRLVTSTTNLVVFPLQNKREPYNITVT